MCAVLHMFKVRQLLTIDDDINNINSTANQCWPNSLDIIAYKISRIPLTKKFWPYIFFNLFIPNLPIPQPFLNFLSSLLNMYSVLTKGGFHWAKYLNRCYEITRFDPFFHTLWVTISSLSRKFLTIFWPTMSLKVDEAWIL
jgi:hypothetical protein